MIDELHRNDFNMHVEDHIKVYYMYICTHAYSYIYMRYGSFGLSSKNATQQAQSELTFYTLNSSKET